MKIRSTRNPLLAWRRALRAADRVEDLEQRLRRLEERTEKNENSATAAEAAVFSAIDGVRTTVDRRFDAIRTHLRELQSASEKLQGDVTSVSLQFDGARVHLEGLQAEAERLMEHRSGAERRFAAVEAHLAGLQQVADQLEERFASEGQAAVAAELNDRLLELQERIVPAAVRRTDALIDRLAGELDELASLVERMLLREPLCLPEISRSPEADLASALSDVQPQLVEAFRGGEHEIVHRLARYLEALRGASPVLDLGAGRGELLLMLRDEGVEAAGVEGDPALAQAARRRGLRVIEGDVLNVLRERPDDSVGAVTAMHLMEHLPAAVLLATLAEIRRVLRPGGELIIECPNPGSIRVGASLLWLDPTHERPLPAETLRLYLVSRGFEIVSIDYLHPFPDDQHFHQPAGTGDKSFDRQHLGPVAERLERLERRLDEVLNGMRDFSIHARKPVADGPTETNNI